MHPSRGIDTPPNGVDAPTYHVDASPNGVDAPTYHVDAPPNDVDAPIPLVRAPILHVDAPIPWEGCTHPAGARIFPSRRVAPVGQIVWPDVDFRVRDGESAIGARVSL